MKAFIIQRCANRFGRYLVVGEYGGGGWHGSIVIPEGWEGKGWFSWVMELHKAAVSFGISIVVDKGVDWTLIYNTVVVTEL